MSDYIYIIFNLCKIEYVHLWRALVQLCTCSSGRSPHRYLWYLLGFLVGSAPGAWIGQKPSFDSHCHPHTQTMWNRENAVKKGSLASYMLGFFFSYSYAFTNLNITKHFWKVVSLCAQAEVVQNVLFHRVQIRIFYLNLLSKIIQLILELSRN